MNEKLATAKEIKMAYIEKLEIPCFEHDWTEWKKETKFEGEGWERATGIVFWRECRATGCDKYQEKTV